VAPKDDDDRSGLTRRSTLKGMGAVLGATAVGCGDDSSVSGTGAGSSSGGVGSTGLDGTSGVADSSTGPSASGEGSTAADSTGTEESTGEPTDECGPDGSGLSPEELLAEIDTIVVVMMENRSFDHFFGSATFRDELVVEGLSGRETNPRLDGTPVPVFHLENLTPADPPHGWESCHFQWNMGAHDGYVRAHELVHPGS